MEQYLNYIHSIKYSGLSVNNEKSGNFETKMNNNNNNKRKSEVEVLLNKVI